MKTAQLENGDMLVLDARNHVAAQLAEREEKPQAAVNLGDLRSFWWEGRITAPSAGSQAGIRQPCQAVPAGGTVAAL